MIIAICEDIREERERLRVMLVKYCKEKFLKIIIEEFVSGEEFFKGYRPGKYSGIFFDIYLGDSLGIELARKVRKNEAVPIIFTTTSQEFYPEGFEVGALHYLVKPVEQMQVNEALERVFKYWGENGRTISISMNGREKRIPIATIACVEVYNHDSFIHTTNGIMRTGQPLKELVTLINEEQFIMSHRSYYINIKFIKEIQSDTILLKNGKEVLVSRNRKSEVLEKYEDYEMGRIWEL